MFALKYEPDVISTCVEAMSGSAYVHGKHEESKFEKPCLTLNIINVLNWRKVT